MLREITFVRKNDVRKDFLHRFNITIPSPHQNCFRHSPRHVRILICVNGGLKHVNTPDSYLRERCAKRAASVLSVA